MPRTFRISEINSLVDRVQLAEYLNGLAYYNTHGNGQPVTENVRVLTLEHFTSSWQRATVTFHNEPYNFEKCTPNDEISLEAEIGGTRNSMVVDCHFLGITPLNTSTEPTVDIIAVTGLAGHAFESWRSSKTQNMWLRDFLHKDVQGLRILTFGYDSALRHSTSTSSIQQFARKLLDDVSSVRSEEIHRPIIFIGHGLGGLVIKQALVEAAQGDSEGDRAIFNSCAGLFFFGVPNKGLNHQNLLSMVKEQPNESLELPDGKWERSGPFVRLVTQDSATWSLPSEALCNQVPINEDHLNIVKFTNRSNSDYINVARRLRKCVEKAPKAINKRLGVKKAQEVIPWEHTPDPPANRKMFKGGI